MQLSEASIAQGHLLTGVGTVGSTVLKLTEEQRKGIPVTYLKTIEAIDRKGWQKMNWARGFTLLHWAGKNGRADLCEFFLQKKADANLQDSTGKTALDYAQQHGKASEEITQLLMNAQVLNARAGEQDFPASLARNAVQG